MKLLGWVVALGVCLVACGSDPPVDPFARLTDCPGWDQSAATGANYCEAICVPPPHGAGDLRGCTAMSIGSKAEDDGIPMTCTIVDVIDGMQGCCLQTGKRVLFFACSSPP